jgi:hypothetical protein
MSRTKNRTRTRVLEEMTFPSDMGSLTFRIIEKEKGDLDGPASELKRDHRLEITTGAHFGYVTNSIPLPRAALAHMLAAALVRTAHYQDAVGTGPGYEPFRSLEADEVTTVRAGLRKRKVYQEEIIVSEHESYAPLVAIEWVDAEGLIAKFERVYPLDLPTNAKRRGYGSYSSSAQFDESEIGLTIREANDRRFQAGEQGALAWKDPRADDVRMIPAGHGVRDDGTLVEPHALTSGTLPPIPTRAGLITAVRFCDSQEKMTQEFLQGVRSYARMDDDDFADLVAEARRQPKPFRP